MKAVGSSKCVCRSGDVSSRLTVPNSACRPRVMRLASSASEGSSRSADSEDERNRLEFGVVGSIRLQNDSRKAASHLNLLWRLQAAKFRQAEPCSCCQGSGEKECDWCHGTGILTLGDALVCSVAEHSNKCPVCRAAGYVPCAHCCGTGYRAKWLGDTNMPGL